ncbi:hypothetical protein [Zhongshania marina]|uniref:Uncharacterized protein n=1 Tax=Zhongshania marina TaxID=2304603 RepID=A0ABX9W7N3_9GAMM|nr:hypothetical protein D0911_04270 [Zhongshania marina]
MKKNLRTAATCLALTVLSTNAIAQIPVIGQLIAGDTTGAEIPVIGSLLQGQLLGLGDIDNILFSVTNGELLGIGTVFITQPELAFSLVESLGLPIAEQLLPIYVPLTSGPDALIEFLLGGGPIIANVIGPLPEIPLINVPL